MSGTISLHEARNITKAAAEEFPESYTTVVDFEPHTWVVAAVRKASETWYDRAVEERLRRVALERQIANSETPNIMEAKFKEGDRVTKKSGSNWTGRVVGTYSTSLTPEGYAVESETEHGSVQIYPATALILA